MSESSQGFGKAINNKNFSVTLISTSEDFLRLLDNPHAYYEGFDEIYYYISTPIEGSVIPYERLFKLSRALISSEKLKIAVEVQNEHRPIETNQNPIIKEYETWKQTSAINEGFP